MAPQLVGSKWLARARLIQRTVGTVAAVIAALAVGYTFLSFSAFGQIRCQAPILGGGVLHRAPTTSFLYGGEKAVCSGDAHSRLTFALIIAVMAFGVALAGWLLPTGLPWWLTGEERPVDDTPEWLLRVLLRFGLPPAGRLGGPESSTASDPGDADEPSPQPAKGRHVPAEPAAAEVRHDEPAVAEVHGDEPAVAEVHGDEPATREPARSAPGGRRAPMPTQAGYEGRRPRRSRR